MGDQAMAYAPRADEPEEPFAARAEHAQRRRLLDAGRILVTGGWLVLTYTTIANRAASAEHALFGFAMLLLGVSMITLSLVANRFPGAARAVAAAVADAVLFYFFAPAI